LYEDIHIRDITLEGRGNLIGVAPWTQYFDLQGHPQPTRKIHNVTFSNIKGTFGSFGSIRPNAGDVIDHIVFENIDVTLTTAGPVLWG